MFHTERVKYTDGMHCNKKAPEVDTEPLGANTHTHTRERVKYSHGMPDRGLDVDRMKE